MKQKDTKWLKVTLTPKEGENSDFSLDAQNMTPIEIIGLLDIALVEMRARLLRKPSKMKQMNKPEIIPIPSGWYKLSIGIRTALGDKFWDLYEWRETIAPGMKITAGMTYIRKKPIL
jgi:hypothetical protein